MIQEDRIQIPSWHPPEFAVHVRELMRIWSAIGEPTDYLHSELQRILNDTRLRDERFWSTIKGLFTESPHILLTRKGIDHDWGKYARGILREMVLKCGDLPKQTIASMKKDRKRYAATVRKLRHHLGELQGAANVKLDVVWFLDALSSRQDDSGSAARAMMRDASFVTKWLAGSCLSLDVMLEVLEDALESGAPIGRFDRIEPSPYESVNRGHHSAKRICLENRLSDYFRAFVGPQNQIDRMMDIALMVALNLDEDDYKSDTAHRRSAIRSKQARM